MSADGSTTVVGALRDEDPNGEDAGSAYVFTQANEGWQRQTKALPHDNGSFDFFGSSVGIAADGNTAVIGALGEDDPNGRLAGSAYVFTQVNGEWKEQAKLFPDDGDGDDYFSSSVGVSADGSTAVIGAPRDGDPNGDRAGSAYVFSLDTEE